MLIVKIRFYVSENKKLISGKYKSRQHAIKSKKKKSAVLACRRIGN